MNSSNKGAAMWRKRAMTGWTALTLAACGGGGGVPEFSSPYIPPEVGPGTDATIVRVAGSGQAGRADGNAADTRATFDQPMGLAADVAGNVLVADSGNQLIRRVSPAGVTTTLAGRGTRGFVDGAPDVAAFDTPSGLAIDADGNAVVADRGNNAVRRVTPQGVVSTVSTAPLTLVAPMAVALDTSGTLFIADTGHDRIVQVRAGEAATVVIEGLHGPAGLAVDAAGTLYVADTGAHVIRRVADGVATVFAGTEDTPGYADNDYDATIPSQFNGPTALAFTADGVLQVIDTGNNAQRRVDPAGLVYTTVVDATRPQGIAVDATGDVFVADTQGNRIERASPLGVSSTLAGARSAGSLTVGPDGAIYVVDTTACVVRKVAHGASTVVAGAGVIGSAQGQGALALFNLPQAVAAGPDGTIYVGDTGNNAVQQISPGGAVSLYAVVTSKVYNSVPPFDLYPLAMAWRADGVLFVASRQSIERVNGFNDPRLVAGYQLVVGDAGDSTVYDNGAGVIDPDGSSIGFYGLAGIAADAQGWIYVSDAAANSVRVFLPGSGPNGRAGTVYTLAGTPDQSAGDSEGTGTAAALNQPKGLVLDADGNLIVVDSGNHKVRKIVVDRSGGVPVGTMTTLAGQSMPGRADGTGTAASFNSPQSIAADGTGQFVVLDGNNHLIRRVSATGVVTTVAGYGSTTRLDGAGGDPAFGAPEALAIDTAGTVYVADTDNHTVRSIRQDGTVTTIAGSGNAAFGDGSGALASFHNPSGVAVDGSGTVYVADTLNQRIRSISNSGGVHTLAGTGAVGAADGDGSAATFNAPKGVAVNDVGTVLIVSDNGNHRIRRLVRQGTRWTVDTLAGSGAPGFADGTGAAAQFRDPGGVALAGNGDAIVADTSNQRVRRVTMAGVVTTVAGSGADGLADGAADKATFNQPTGVAVDASGRIVVADSANNLVRRIALDGSVTRLAGKAPPYDNNAFLDRARSPFNGPSAVVVGADGAIYVSNSAYHTIDKIVP